MTTTQSGYDLVPNELYETQFSASMALFRHLDITGMWIWEPSAGNHKIAHAAYIAGAKIVYTSDIAQYDHSHNCNHLDFFTVNRAPSFCNGIITNPPYGVRNNTATKYARHALNICDEYVVLLLTVKFDSGKTRTDLFRDNPRFMMKITLLDRLIFFGDEPGTEDHAWFVWRPKYAPIEPSKIIYENC